MTEPTTPTGVPTLQDKRTAPPGVLPRNGQTLVLGGIAALMVIVLAFSGRTPNKPVSSTPAASSVLDPSAARIQDYQRRIEEQTKKLQLEQALESEQALARGRATGGMARGNLASGFSTRSSPRGPVPADLQEQERRALSASNIALSYRKDLAGVQPLSGTPPPIDALARLLASSGYPPASVSPVPGLVPSALPSSAPPSGPGERPTTAAGQLDRRMGSDRADAGASKDSNSSLADSDGKRYRIFEGTFLETVLTNRLDGAFSGPVNCMVTTNVYSHDGQHLLIPQGARVLGEVRKVESFGQERLAVFFHRLIMPNEFSLSLDTFLGLNQVGETGLKDQINHHYLQVFGVSLAIGAIAGLGQINSRSGFDVSATEAYEQGVSSSLSQSSLRILDRYLNVLPTVTIREGHRVKIYLSGDILLPAYDEKRGSNDL